jgi:RHS repeat-associated protein
MNKKLQSALARVLIPGYITFLFIPSMSLYSQGLTTVNVPLLPPGGSKSADIPHASYNSHQTAFKAIARGGGGLNFQWDYDVTDNFNIRDFRLEVNTFTGNLFVKIPFYWCKSYNDPPERSGRWGFDDDPGLLDDHPGCRINNNQRADRNFCPGLCYNSGKTRRDSGYGQGIASFFDVCIKVTLPTATVTREDGREDVFTWDGARFVPPPGVFDTLTEYISTHYRLRTKYGTEYFFDEPDHYKVTSKADRNGNLTSFTYDAFYNLVAITFPNTRQISLEYEDGHVARLIELSAVPNRVTTFKYNIFDELTEINSPEGVYLKFSYGYWGNMKSITDGSGHTVYIDYNENKAVSHASIPAESIAKSFIYNAVTRTTSVIDSMLSGERQTRQYIYDPNGRITELVNPDLSSCQLSYDADNNVLTCTNENLKIWSFAYDLRGNMTAAIDPEGNTALWAYDPVFNHVQNYTSPNGFPTNYYYNLKGNLDSIVDAYGKKSYTYDTYGNLRIYKDRNGKLTWYFYDSFFDVTSIKNPLNLTNTYTYDGWGNMITSKDKKNRTTHYTYDKNNRLTKIVNPANDSVRFHPPDSFFDIYFDLVINEAGDSIKFTYDGAGMLAKVTDPLKRSVEYTRDEVGNITSIKDPAGNYAYYEYDDMNRLVEATDAAGGVEQFAYDPVGRMTSYKNKNDSLTWFFYDDADRLTSIKDCFSNTESFNYDFNGNWTKYTDQLGREYNIAYDALDMMTSVTDPEGNTETAVYDPEGNMIIYTNRNGNSTIFGYNSLNWLIGKADPLGFLEKMNYDQEGNLVKYTDKNSNSTLYGYDLLDRRISATDALGKSEHQTYDKKGNRTSWTDKNGNTTSYEYDAADQMLVRRDAKGKEDLFGYNVLGYRILHTDRRGKTTNYQYDPLGRLLSLTDPFSKSEIYTYDDEGNQVSFTDKKGNQTLFNYDGLNRLITVKDHFLVSEYYGYDAAGNQVSMTNRNGQVYSYSYDSLNRLVKTSDPLGNYDSITYDPEGRVIEMIDAEGNETNYTYDCCHLTGITDPSGFTQTFVHDSAGNVIRQYDKMGLLTRFEYDDLNRIIKVIDTLDYYMTFGYDNAGNETMTVNKNGDTTRFYYDVLGRLTEKRDPYGNSYYHLYDEVGNRIALTDRRGKTTQYQYDALNRLIKITDPLSEEEEFFYDYAGNLSRKTNKNGDTTKYFYNQLNRLVQMKDAANNSETYAYDNTGNMTSRQDRRGLTTLYYYDAAGRLTQVTDPKGNSAYMVYDSAGNVVQEIDRDGNFRFYTYDPLNHLTAKTDAMGNTLQYAYNGNGNLVLFKDANNHFQTFLYDSLNRLSASISQLGFVTQWFYDPMGNLIKRVRPTLDTTWYEYNKNQRLTKTTYPNGRMVQNLYDPEMNLLRVTGNGAVQDTTIHTYDDNNRITSTQRKYGSLFSKTTNYTFDAAGHITNMTQGSDVTEYLYDSLGQLTRIVNPQLDTTQYQYNAGGMRTGYFLENGISATYVYDNADYLASLTWKESDLDTIVSYNYTYDNEGNKAIMKEIYPPSTFSTGYFYDLAGRLIRVNTSWGDTTVFTYDGAGNRLNKTKNELLTSYFYDNDNRLVNEFAPGGPVNYTFDNNGNLILKQETGTGKVTTYAYDYENRLVQAAPTPGTPVSYDYFAGGQRMSRTASPPVYYNYTCSYCEVCCQWYCTSDYQYDGSGNVTESYTTGPFTDEHISLDAGGITNYLVTDGLGTVTIQTDELENTVASWEYDAFGNITFAYGSSNNDYHFQGKGYDDLTGQYDYVNRQYDPSTGRFTSLDPLFSGQLTGCGGGCNPFRIGPSSDDPDSHSGLSTAPDEYFGPGSDPFEGQVASHHIPDIQTGSMNNLYAFVNNNPASYIDPLGLAYLPASARAVLNSHSTVNPWNNRNDNISGRLFSKPSASSTGFYDGCRNGGSCSCSTSGLMNYFRSMGPCFIEPFGQTQCDLNKPSCADFDTKINNNTCTRVCTERHEAQHQKDMKGCCDKARDAWGNVLKKWEDTYRSRGLSGNTLKKKLDNLENDPHVRAERANVMKQYNNYSQAANRWTECNADQVSIDCANELWEKYKCDCPPPENKQCCKDIEHYKKVAQGRQKDKKCPKEGQPPLQEPPCPF